MAERGRPKKVVEVKEDNKINNTEIKEEVKKEKVEIKEEVKKEKVEVKEEVKKEKIVEKPKTRKAPTFDMNYDVRVISLVKSGNLIFVDQDGAIYEWAEYGSDNYMSVKSLLHMRNRNRGFFTTPLVKIAEDDVAQFLRVDTMYNDLIDVENIDDVFDLSPDDLSDILIKSPKGIQDIIADAAKEKYANKTLDSMQKIRIIQNICKTEIIEETDKIIIMNNK